jgi:plasmid replication initiation protein
MSHEKAIVLSMNNLKNNQLVIKSNYLVEASYKLTTQEQRIILLVASMIKPNDEDFQTYCIEIKNFMKLVGVSGHSKYEEIKEITKKLRERTLIIKNLIENTVTQVGWVSSFKYFNREGYIQIRLDPELKPYFLKLKRHFTQYQLQNVIRLKSAYSIRLYELFKQYEKIGERYFELSDLKKILGIGADKYRLYGDFKRKILNRAKKELSKQTDLKFTFSEKKKGRKVIGVHFFIKSKQDQKPLQEIANLELYERLQQYFCLSPAQARDILSNYQEDNIIENLNHVERRYEKGEIKDIGAYTLKAVKENIRDQLSLFDVEKKQESERRKQVEAEKQRQERLESDYKAFRYNEVEKYKKTLPETELGQIEVAVSEEVKNKSKSGIGFKTFVRLELEKKLASLVGIPSFEDWARQQN